MAEATSVEATSAETPVLQRVVEEAPGRPGRTLETDRGPVAARHYPPAGPATGGGVILVGGVGGGWDSPARDLYGRLADALPDAGLHVLRVRYRLPHHLEACVHDIRAGIRFLEQQGVEEVGLVGHSLGGAAVIRAAAIEPRVRAVVAISSQTAGAEEVEALGPRCAVLFLHGTADPILPSICSVDLHRRARAPRRIALLEGGDHGLDAHAREVTEEAREWLLGHLPGP